LFAQTLEAGGCADPEASLAILNNAVTASFDEGDEPR
jgi:hypothetical protein